MNCAQANCQTTWIWILPLVTGAAPLSQNAAVDAFITKFNAKAYLGMDARANIYPAAQAADSLVTEFDAESPVQEAIDDAWD